MSGNINRRNFIKALLICAAAGAGALSLPSPAADPSPETEPIECRQYQMRSKVAFEDGKAFSDGSAEYNFALKLSEGVDDPACSTPATLHTARVHARWDAGAKRAYETIRHQPPAQGRLTEIVLSCAGNPWIATVEPVCVQLDIHTDNMEMASPPLEGPLPLTAHRLGEAGRQRIAATVAWVGVTDFIRAPATPPQIVTEEDGGDIDGRFFKRNTDVRIQIRRPLDGSPEWHARNPASYDVQIQIKTAGGWAHKSPLAYVSGEPALLRLPYADLFEDADANWDIESYPERGKFRWVRVRARLHEEGVSRPWSNWRSFLVQVPLPKLKMPSSSVGLNRQLGKHRLRS